MSSRFARQKEMVGTPKENLSAIIYNFKIANDLKLKSGNWDVAIFLIDIITGFKWLITVTTTQHTLNTHPKIDLRN